VIFLICIFVVTTDLVADVVTEWNEVTLNIIRGDPISPPWASRTLAMVHVAMFDAINSIEQECQPYRVSLPAPEGASPEAAGAAAAYRILSDQYPKSQAFLDEAYTRTLSAIPDAQARADGEAVGLAVADEILAWRSTDHATDAVAYTPGTQPGQWRPTPTSFQAALLPGWGMVTPFTMTSGSQFRTAGPPALDSVEWAQNYVEVKMLGSKNSTLRTADQTQTALFWSDGANTGTPPGHWNTIGQVVSSMENYSLTENARLFALLNIALADAAISSWDAKFKFDFWRPITAIREGEMDGNADTVADSTWEPLIATPPFPETISGHSTFSSSAARVLTLFTNDVTYEFSVGSDGLPGVARTFQSFTDAAREAGRSRIYGGIHYQFSNEHGMEAGNKIGKQAFTNFLNKVEEPPPGPPLFGLCANFGLIMIPALFWGAKILLK
jgi:hypothetical protein